MTISKKCKFKIGDRVILIDNGGEWPIIAKVGAKGIVRGYDEVFGEKGEERLLDIKWIRNDLAYRQMNGFYEENRFERMCNEERECKTCKNKLKCITEK